MSYIQRHPATCEALPIVEHLVEADLEGWPGVTLAPWGVSVTTPFGRTYTVNHGNHLVLTGPVENGYSVQNSDDFAAEWALIEDA